MVDGGDSILDGASSGETSGSSATEQGPDFAKGLEAFEQIAKQLSHKWFSGPRDQCKNCEDLATVRSVLSAAEAEIARLRACEQVLLALHTHLGIEWGDDPYWAVKQLRAALESARKDTEHLVLALYGIGMMPLYGRASGGVIAEMKDIAIEAMARAARSGSPQETGKGLSSPPVLNDLGPEAGAKAG